MSIYLSFVIRSRSLTDIIPKAQATRASDLLICAYCCTHRRMQPHLAGSAFACRRSRAVCAPGSMGKIKPGLATVSRPSTEQANYSKSPRRRQGRILEMESCTIKRIKKPRGKAPGSARPALPRWPARRGAGCPPEFATLIWRKGVFSQWRRGFGACRPHNNLVTTF